jgi:hypothetical protein
VHLATNVGNLSVAEDSDVTNAKRFQRIEILAQWSVATLPLDVPWEDLTARDGGKKSISEPKRRKK